MSNLAQIDSNNHPTLLAYNETTGLVETLTVDPVTGYLNIYITANTTGTPSTLNTMQIDANDNPTSGAYNETTGLVEALRCSDDGSLIVTLA